MQGNTPSGGTNAQVLKLAMMKFFFFFFFKRQKDAELMNYVKVEAAVLGSPSLIILMVSVDVEQH